MEQLIDSINDTTRMTRTMMSLLLLTALYLSLTLVFATDEKLLRNDPVFLPQIGIANWIKETYIFAPVVFLYLHIQALYFMGVLRRKVWRFLDEYHGEYWDYLSGFSFVQCWKPGRQFEHVRARLLARLLILLSCGAIPLSLLLAVDLSFIRYQSWSITVYHHAIVGFDFIAIMYFYLTNRGGYEREVITRIKWVLAGALSLFMLVFFRYALPPTYDAPYHDYSLENIQKKDENFTREAWGHVDLLNMDSSPNLLDIGPCHWWKFACRYVSINREWLLDGGWTISLPPKQLFDVVNNEYKGEIHRHMVLGEMDLHGRSLQFAQFNQSVLAGANLVEVQLQGANLASAYLQRSQFINAGLQGANLSRAQLQKANLRSAQLQEAELIEAQLQEADLTGAQLQGANLYDAQLQKADLRDAKLQKANLRSAQLQEAELIEAQLQEADLTSAQLRGASLEDAQLQEANLSKAQMQSADLSEAQLQGANLSEAQLQGANLSEAQLQGANLSEAQLQGANLTGAQLQGADLRSARLQCTMFVQVSLWSACPRYRRGAAETGGWYRRVHSRGGDEQADEGMEP